MYLSNQIHRVYFWINIISSDRILIIDIKSGTQNRIIAQRNGPEIRIRLTNCTINKCTTLGLIIIVIYSVTIFVICHIWNIRCRVATIGQIIEVNRCSIIESITVPSSYVNVSGQLKIHTCKIGHPKFHMIMYVLNTSVRRALFDVGVTIKRDNVPTFQKSSIKTGCNRS